jgi:hypothetical protein
LGNGERKDCSARLALGKKLLRPHLNQWLGMVIHIHHFSYRKAKIGGW